MCSHSFVVRDSRSPLPARSLRVLDGCRAGFGHFLVLLRALRTTDADGANDLVAELDGHAALQRGEIRRQRRHRETALVDDVLEILGRLLEQHRRLRLSDRDVRAGGERAIEPDEVEQVPAVVHDCDGAARRPIRPGVGNGGVSGLLCSVEGERLFSRHIVTSEGGRSGQEESETDFVERMVHSVLLFDVVDWMTISRLPARICRASCPRDSFCRPSFRRVAARACPPWPCCQSRPWPKAPTRSWC